VTAEQVPVPDHGEPAPDGPLAAPDGPLAVSLDVSAVPTEPVGAGRYTVELVRALVRRAEVTLTLWCRTDDGDRWRQVAGSPHRVRPVAPRPRPLRLAWEQTGLPLRLRRGSVAVHHGPHYTMPVLAPVPAVVTVHDLTFVDHPEWHEPAKVLVFRQAIALARRRAAVVVCVSDATARRLRQTGPVAGRLLVVPHGVDHRRFRPDEPEPGADERTLAALGVRRPYLLFLGTIEPRKQVDVLVRAFDAIAASQPELLLVLAGRSGWGTDPATAAIAASPHRRRIVQTGYVLEAAVPALLRQAAAVCYPAAEEGFGLPALEAVACGAPLVTTAGSVMAELVGEAAVTAPAGSVAGLVGALQAVLAGGDAAAARRQVGLEVAAARTWDASAAGHVRAYRLAAGRCRWPDR